MTYSNQPQEKANATKKRQPDPPTESHPILELPPRPGVRQRRRVWVDDTDVDVWETPRQATNPWAAPVVISDTPTRKRTREKLDGKRLEGIDAARGFALLGMVAVHTLPAHSAETGEATATWTLFAGNAAALFAVLAGISLAFMTGGQKPRVQREGWRSRVGMATRALLLMFIGLALNQFENSIYNILVYYGLFFFLAIPFTMLRPSALIASAAAFFSAGPFLIFWSVGSVGVGRITDPLLADVIAQPANFLATIFITGTYPALTWMGFICLGMALGRLDLRSIRIQIGILLSATLMVGLSMATSTFLIYRGGAYEAIMEHTPQMSADAIDTVLVYGPNTTLPTTTLWWMSTIGPHTNTTLALIYSAGMALIAASVFLILSRFIRHVLMPLTAMGAMTLTLYSAHLIFFSVVDVSENETGWFLAQMGIAMVFALAWRFVIGQGPLEAVVSTVSRVVSKLLVPMRKSLATDSSN